MIKLLPNENDDKDFITLVEQILLAEISFTQSENVFITKINHSFDFKWRGFSHKIFGELGVWREPLRIPPFIPDRILEEIHFEKNDEIYMQKDQFQLHIYQPSSEDAERKINRKSALYVWFSGNTSNNSQGSLMIYKFGEEFQSSWYVSFLKKVDWQIYKTDRISRSEILALI